MSFSFTEPTATHPTTTENTPDVPETTDAATDSGADVSTVDAGEVPEVTESTTEGEDGGAGDGEPDGEPKPDDSATDPEGEPESGEEPTFFFGDLEVEIDIPDDVDAALKEKGLNAKEIAAELYAKDGSFQVSDETKQKLYDAFGKFAVDAYLGGLKAQNENFVYQMERDAAALEQANAERYEVVSKEVGGEEGWNALERFALDTLPDEELAAFNAVMESGNQYLQMYAVRELEARRKQAQGDDKVTLVDATGAASSGNDNSPLSGADYVRAIASLGQKYGTDKVARAAAEKALDARRMAGMKAGL